MLQRKDKIVSGLTGGIDGLFRKNKITRYRGQARLEGPGRVVVESSDEKQELTAKNIIIATGSKPAPLRGIEFDGDRIGTSTEALSYPSVPEPVVVIGAGDIGLEQLAGGDAANDVGDSGEVGGRRGFWREGGGGRRRGGRLHRGGQPGLGGAGGKGGGRRVPPPA